MGERAKRIGRILGLIVCYSLANTSLSAQVNIEGKVLLEPASASAGRISIGGYQSMTSRDVKRESASDSMLIWLENDNEEISYVQHAAPRILDQVNKRFKPRLMGIRVGDLVRIKNSDPVYHNVFSLSGTKRFDVGRRSPEDYLDIQFDKAGLVDVFCDIHSDMHAAILVLPKHTVAWKKIGSSGAFRFKNIPEGLYTLHFFSLGNRKQSIPVKAVGTEKVILETVRLGAE